MEMKIYIMHYLLFLGILLVTVLVFLGAYIVYKTYNDKKEKILNSNFLYELSEEEQENFIMPKYLKIIIILLIVSSCFFIFIKIKDYYDNEPEVLPNGTVVYDFSRQRQAKASRILYEYVYAYYIKYSSSILEKYRLSENYISAFEYDLNNDGDKEIIGYINSKEYKSHNGYNLYILKKVNRKNLNTNPNIFKINNIYYEDISTVIGLDDNSKIYILPSTNLNEYKNMKILCFEYPVSKECEIEYGKNINDNYGFKQN